MKTTAIALEAMNCRTLEVIRFGSYYAAKLEGFDPAFIREWNRESDTPTAASPGGWQAATHRSLRYSGAVSMVQPHERNI